MVSGRRRTAQSDTGRSYDGAAETRLRPHQVEIQCFPERNLVRNRCTIKHGKKHNRKTTCWSSKATVDGQYIEGSEKAGLTLYDITTGRNRVRLEELVGDRERWKDITAASMARQAFKMITWLPWPDLIKHGLQH